MKKLHITEQKVRQFANRVASLLEQIQWNGDYCELEYDWDENPEEEWHYFACPCCMARESEGHDEGCDLKALLDEAYEIAKGGCVDGDSTE